MKPGLLMLPSAVSDSHVHNILPNKIDTDFQFSRASAATRVNHQGLIENVGYFSDELVRNGNFSELGPELITNGDFAIDSNWGKGIGWSINNGVASCDGTQTSGTQLTQTSLTFTNGKTYKVVFTCTIQAGNLDARLQGSGATVTGDTVTTSGTYTQYLVSTGNTSFRMRGNPSFIGTVDNVSVKQVDPNSEWSLVDIKFTGTNTFENTATNGRIFQSFTTVIGSQYKVSFTINSGLWNIYASTNNNSSGQIVSTSPTTASGFFEFTATTTTSFLAIYNIGASGSVASITNISVVEVIGDKPRLDYDPINPTCPHLLLEPQSTNLFTFSENFNNGWSVNQTTLIANSGICPDGTNNAFNLVANAANSVHLLATTVSSTNLRTISIFAKQNGYKRFRFNTGSSGNGFASFDLSNGTVAGSGGTFFNSAKIQPLANNWYRCSLTINSGGGTNPTIAMEDDAGNVTFLGDGISGILIWGAQLEELSYPTSYIPTAGATETRVQETCTSAGNVNTFNNSEGTIYAEIAGLVSSTTLRSIGISDGTSANRVNISLWQNGGNDQLLNFVGLGGVSQCNFFGAVNSILEFNKVAFNYKQNDFKMYINGVLVGTDTSGNTFPADTLIKFNFDRGEGNSRFFGKTKALATYNRALTDTELYTITSTQYSAYSGMVAALGNYTIPC